VKHVMRMRCINYSAGVIEFLTGVKMNRLILLVLFAVLYQVHTVPLHTEEGKISNQLLF